MARGNDTENTNPTARYLTRATGVNLSFTPFKVPKGSRVTTKATKKATKADKPKEEPKATAGNVPEFKSEVYQGERARSVERYATEIASGKALDKNKDEWVSANNRGQNDSDLMMLGYKHAKDSGLLKGEGKLNSTDKVIEAFRTRVDASKTDSREYGMTVDRNGHLINTVRGGTTSILQRTPQGHGFEAGDQRSVTAGSTFNHNHPRSMAVGGIGLSISGGDISSTVAKARAVCIADAREGVYVLKNNNWEKHATMSTLAVRSESKVHQRVWDSAWTKAGEDTKKWGRDYVARTGKVPDIVSFNKASAHFLLTNQKAVASRLGYSIDFVPNAGYESILTGEGLK